MLTFPATSGQQWYFQAAPDGSCNDNVEMAWWLRGSLYRDTLQTALDALVRRHASLRTTLATRQAAVIQQIHEPAPVEIEDVDATDPQAVTALATEPFTVHRGPLVRARLGHLTPEEHLLVLVAHHAVCDGWSAALIHRDLVEIHRALCQQRSPKLPVLPVHMGDYAVWEQRALHCAVGPYWRERLSSGHPRLRLGCGAAADDQPAHVRTFTLPDLSSATADRLEKLSSTHATTLPRVLGAGVIAALIPYTEREITVSVVTANRSRPQLVNVVGNLAEQIPVRVDLPHDLTFSDLIDHFSNGVTGAYDHTFTSNTLRRVMRQNPERSKGPIFDLEINWFGRPAAQYAIRPARGELNLTEIDIPANKKEHRFTHWLDRLPVLGFAHQPGADGTITGFLQANVTAVEPADAEGLGQKVSAMIEYVSQNPNTRLSDLPLLSA